MNETMVEIYAKLHIHSNIINYHRDIYEFFGTEIYACIDKVHSSICTLLIYKAQPILMPKYTVIHKSIHIIHIQATVEHWIYEFLHIVDRRHTKLVV